MVTRQIQITDDAVAKYKAASIDDALLQAIFNVVDAQATEVHVAAVSRNDELFHAKYCITKAKQEFIESIIKFME